MARKETYVEQRGNTWRVRKTVKGKRVTATFDHKPTESEITIAISKQIVKPSVKGDKRTFEDCAKEFIEVNDGSLTENTIGEYKSALNRLPNWFCETRLENIDSIVAQRAISEYAKQPTPHGGVKCKKTVDNVWHFASVVLRTFGIHGVEVHTSGKASDDGYMPTEKDITRLLQHIKGTEEEVPVMISAFASLRQGELLALTMDDVKDGMIHVNKAMTKNGNIQLHPKNKTSVRYTPIPKELEKLIHKKGYIYRWNANTLREHFNEACAECGLKHFNFHKLRSYYTCAAHYLGIPDKYIMKNGGWKTDHTLKKNYMRALADKQADEDKQIVAHFSKIIKSAPKVTPKKKKTT